MRILNSAKGHGQCRGILVICFFILLVDGIASHSITHQHKDGGRHGKALHHGGDGNKDLSYLDGPYIGPIVTRARPTPNTYNTLRELFFQHEESQALGSDIELTAREEEANAKIMQVKLKEYDEGLVTPHLFNPSQHIFSVLDAIRQSPLFDYMTIMPKGAILHAHDTALVSTDFLIELTYRPNLWVCQKGVAVQFDSMKFERTTPTIQAGNCTWQLLATLRSANGAAVIDDYLRSRFSLYPTQKFEDINAVWVEFVRIFSLLDGLLFYAPNWADYYYQALEEMLADGVQYLEFRSTVPTLYDMDGTTFTTLDTVRIYAETLEKFKTAHSDFIGSRMIYAPLRYIDDNGMATYIKNCIEMKDKYPDFVAGFDLVGQEELGRPLKDFIPQLLTIPENIDFFFHAGETNWFGSTVDENVIDAVLLGTKRIGHGFAVVKHPLVLKMLKAHNIAVEVNPVSNQVLQLVTDYRNHPCSQLFADNYPVVISSDDPSFWKATPLSHDFYIAFLGIASAHSDLRLLKKLALNSLQYSSLSVEQKTAAVEKWQIKWDAFIEEVITGVKDNGAAGNRID